MKTLLLDHRKPETKLLNAVLDSNFKDDGLRESIEGQTLRNFFYLMIEEIKLNYASSSPSFSSRIKRLIELKFGFESQQELSYEEIGREFGLTGERVRQLGSRALRCLRLRSRNKLESYIVNGHIIS